MSTSQPRMRASAFAIVLCAHRLDSKSKSARAARMVLVDGLSRNAAATKAKVDVAAVSRIVKRLQEPLCPCCGRPVS